MNSRSFASFLMCPAGPFEYTPSKSVPHSPTPCKTHRQVVLARPLLLQCLDVILPPGRQRNRLRFLLGTVLPRARRGVPTHLAELDFLLRIFARAQPQFAGVIAGDPERVVPVRRRHD